jgi:hypothetical protein
MYYRASWIRLDGSVVVGRRVDELLQSKERLMID